MNEDIVAAVNKLFIATDKRDWNQVKAIFSDTVLLGYTSMAGGQPATLTASQIIDAWKGFVTRFR